MWQYIFTHEKVIILVGIVRSSSSVNYLFDFAGAWTNQNKKYEMTN
jgi:hypothetical protein